MSDKIAREEYRQDLISNTTSSDRFQEGSYGFHELVDRLSIIHSMMENIVEHPSCFLNPELFNETFDISCRLGQLYNKASIRHLNAEAE